MIALVPIKEHSERIPRKNFRPFCGIPLYRVILETLMTCPPIEHIYVDTDSREIRDFLRDRWENVTALNRPGHLRGDHVSVNLLIHNVLQQVEGEHFIQTHCTNPLLSSDLLVKAIRQYFSGLERYDSLFSVTSIQSRLYDHRLKALNHDPAKLLRTQDLPVIYEENSNFYIFSRAGFLGNQNNRLGKRPDVFVMAKNDAVDIDNEEDFVLAEMLYRAGQETTK